MLTKNLPARAVCAALAAVLLVAGCGDGSESDGPTIEKTSSSAAPTTPTAVVPTPGTRPKDDRSDASAIAFSEFVIGRVVSVSTGGNADDLLALTRGVTCKTCITLVQRLKKAGTVKQELETEPVITGAKVADTSGDEYVVEQQVELGPGRKVDTATGKVTETFDKSTSTFRVLMTWTDGQWILTDYSAKGAS